MNTTRITPIVNPDGTPWTDSSGRQMTTPTPTLAGRMWRQLRHAMETLRR